MVNLSNLIGSKMNGTNEVKVGMKDYVVSFESKLMVSSKKSCNEVREKQKGNRKQKSANNKTY